MVTWDYPPRCLAPHALPTRPHYEALTWHSPPGDTHPRIVRWTCACTSIYYELCQANGLRFIRRTTLSQEKPSINETNHWPTSEADAIWIGLLHGLVR